METHEFNVILQEKTKMAERIIRSFLPQEEGYQKTVIQAMNYSITVGGKRLRPLLMEETFHFCGGREEDLPLLEPFMAAIEMIHTYSLVHDDLPAMDNDQYRRGKKTTWSAYGEAMGILAGDGLLNYAFETALQALEFCGGGDREYLTTAPCPEYNMQRVTKAMGILANKAGIYGMIGGQTADIEAEGQEGDLEKEQLLFIHGHKTAALIQAAMMIGAVIAGVTEEERLGRLPDPGRYPGRSRRQPGAWKTCGQRCPEQQADLCDGQRVGAIPGGRGETDQRSGGNIRCPGG